MIYAPKRKRNGRWDFTATDNEIQGGETRPFGFCLEHWNSGNQDGHHDNPKAAVQCYLNFILDRGIEYGNYNITLLPCALCGVKTIMCASSKANNQPFLILCSAHCNETSIRKFFDKNLAFEVVEEAHEHPTDPIIIPDSAR